MVWASTILDIIGETLSPELLGEQTFSIPDSTPPNTVPDHALTAEHASRLKSISTITF
jgi:hypothetical protein